MKLGNGLYETRDFHTPGTTTSYKLGTYLGGGDKAQLGYSYSATNNNGNLESQTIQRFGGDDWTQNFYYDGLNRLERAQEIGGIGPTRFDRRYDYDQYGNRGLASTSTGPAHNDPKEPALNDIYSLNNRLKASFLGSEGYDDAGNQKIYGSHNLEYDAENRNTTVKIGNTIVATYSYDGEGRRVSKALTPAGGPATTTYFVYDALGQLAAEYSTETPTSTGISWIFTDMLGSIRAVTSNEKYDTECYDYLPFGRMLSASDNARGSVGETINGTFHACYPTDPDTQIASNAPQKFTGKEGDAETGLDYFGARYYSGAHGRFTTVDPDNAGA